MFSVGDMYHRVKSFKKLHGESSREYFFAKVDVKAAFDTIPQDSIIHLMNRVLSERRYDIIKHCEITTSDDNQVASLNKATRRWKSHAKPAGDQSEFQQAVEAHLAPKKKNTVFVDSIVQRSYDTRSLLALMTTHIRQNLVKIGKKYYRQKDGIPQGSILSSLLCSFFYADLEAKHLCFLQSDDCLLLRLIDDFLLITTDKYKATRFVTVMHRGLPDYGVQVGAGKSLVNFHLEVDGTPVSQVQPAQGFPFCGTLLDCKTLDIGKDRRQTKDPVIANALTVEFSRNQGQNFRRKVLNAFRIQSHLMFFDTSHNAPQTMLRNIYDAFREAATKMWAYAKCLPRARQPSLKLLLGQFP
jgi:telomerase reverse transcriptase